AVAARRDLGRGIARAAHEPVGVDRMARWWLPRLRGGRDDLRRQGRRRPAERDGASAEDAGGGHGGSRGDSARLVARATGGHLIWRTKRGGAKGGGGGGGGTAPFKSRGIYEGRARRGRGRRRGGAREGREERGCPGARRARSGREVGGQPHVGGGGARGAGKSGARRDPAGRGHVRPRSLGRIADRATRARDGVAARGDRRALRGAADDRA